MCGLTPRSSGEPTARRLARGAVLFIISPAGQSSRRRLPLSSNVRRHMRTLMLLAALLPALWPTAIAATPKTQQVEVRARSIIAFAPSELKDSDEDGAMEAVAHLRFAVEDTYRCLQPMKLSVSFYYADRIALRTGKTRELLQVHKLGQAVGAIIVEPGRKPEVIYSTDGPSTLQQLLPQAAARYWATKACEQ
jgi:hypothetical protein